MNYNPRRRIAPINEQRISNEVSFSRLAIFEILHRVEQREICNSTLLEKEISKLRKRGIGNLSQEDADRRLIQEISFGVLRWRGWLDAVIAQLAERPIESITIPIRIALRIGLYQLVFLTRVPPSAAVNESVNLIKRIESFAHTSGFVNGILRSAIRLEIKMPDLETLTFESTKLQEYETVLSHPYWLLRNWNRQWGIDQAVRIAKENNVPAPIYLWINPLRTNVPEMYQKLEELQISIRSLDDNGQTCELISGSIRSLRPFIESGELYIQDATSQQIARWLEAKPGQNILDLCAAPGGKTAQIAATMNNIGSITALESSSFRFEEMQTNCNRLGVKILNPHLVDASEDSIFKNDLVKAESFDAVLVDVPCSGTGTLRRHPEIKWNLETKKISELSDLQLRLLENAAMAVKPGGILLYSTCSLEEKEGEGVARIFRNKNRNFEIFSPEMPEANLTSEGFIRTWPYEGPDGFFVARFRRRM